MLIFDKKIFFINKMKTFPKNTRMPTIQKRFFYIQKKLVKKIKKNAKKNLVQKMKKNENFR